MNKNVHYTTQFKKDFKQCIKRGYNMQKIKSIIYKNLFLDLPSINKVFT